MIKFLRALLCLLICAIMLPMAALAEDCFVIDVDSLDMNSLNNNDYVAANLSGQAAGIRVLKYISDSSDLATAVRLTVTQAETSTVVFDKNYGAVGGTFDSGDIYLPYVDNNAIPYLITLNIGDWTYAMPFMQLQPRLSHNSACTFGVRLRDYNPAITNNWLMGTMLDLDALRSLGQMVLPVCASNLYTVGQATLSMSGDSLSVSLDFDQSASVEVHGCVVYLIGDVNSLTTDNPAAISLPAYAVGQPIDTTGLSTALLYLPISLSYNPSDLSEFGYDLNSEDLSAQLTMWSMNAQGAGASIVIAEPTAEPTAEVIVEPAATDTPVPDCATPVDPTPGTDGTLVVNP